VGAVAEETVEVRAQNARLVGHGPFRRDA